MVVAGQLGAITGLGPHSYIAAACTMSEGEAAESQVIDRAQEKESSAVGLAAIQMSYSRKRWAAAGNPEEEGFMRSCSDVESGHSFQTHAIP